MDGLRLRKKLTVVKLRHRGNPLLILVNFFRGRKPSIHFYFILFYLQPVLIKMGAPPHPPKLCLSGEDPSVFKSSTGLPAR